MSGFPPDVSDDDFDRYALEDHPVLEQRPSSSYDEYPECPECEGRGYLIHGPEPVQQGEPCHVCKGKGHIETPSPLGKPSFSPAVLANAEQSPTPAYGPVRPAKAMRCEEKNYRRLLEESNLPIELAVEIANALDAVIDRERLANMRADQAEEALAATQSATLQMPRTDEILLACGEMKASELRAVKAALGWFIRRAADNRSADKGQG